MYFRTKKYMQHILNMQCWHRPLPNANLLPETIAPLSSDLEVSEFAFQRDSLREPMLYLVEVTSIGEIDVHVNVWGTTSKNHLNGKYKPIFLVGAESSPTTDASLRSNPHPWLWTLPVAAIDELLVMRSIELRPKGIMVAESRRCVKAVPPTHTFRKFIS